LITLPCPNLASRAVFRLTSGGPVRADIASPKAVRSAELTLLHLGMDNRGGRLELASDIPRGRGMGSSTADVVATVRAVANAAGRVLPPAEIASIAVAAEIASDSLMYDRPTLFAQREGIVLESYPCALPPFTLVGGDLCDGTSGVETLSLPQPQHSSWELAGFRVLRGAARRALTTGDTRLLGRVATASARINQRHRPLSRLDEILARYGAWGSLGVQVAHSGTVVGLICPLGDQRTLQRSARGLRKVGVRETWSFDVGVC
jgi:uncharacterized protein involved in propanediol utilization